MGSIRNLLDILMRQVLVVSCLHRGLNLRPLEQCYKLSYATSFQHRFRVAKYFYKSTGLKHYVLKIDHFTTFLLFLQTWSSLFIIWKSVWVSTGKTKIANNLKKKSGRGKFLYESCQYSNGYRAGMQRSKFSLEVQTCSYFSQLKVKFDLKQELNIPGLHHKLKSIFNI
jgi:hypothetical protein